MSIVNRIFNGSLGISQTFLFDAWAGSAGGIASAAASIAGSLISAHTQNRNTDKAIAAQREENERAYQRNLEQWERENDYNTPTAQMQRLRDAGLNPNLAYGTPNLSSPSPTLNPTDMSALANKRSVLGTALESPLNQAMIQAQIRNLNADSLNKETDAAGKGINNKRDEISLRVEQALVDKKIQMYDLELENIAGEILVNDDKRNLLLAQAKYSQGLNEYLSASVDKINQDIAESKSRTLLNRIDSYTRNQYNNANIRNILAQANITERQYSELVATFLERQGIQINTYESSSKQLQMLEQSLQKAITDNDWNAVEHLTGILSSVVGAAGDIVDMYGTLKRLNLPDLGDYVDRETSTSWTDEDGTKHISRSKSHVRKEDASGSYHVNY